jgi:HlyD family secretion protein
VIIWIVKEGTEVKKGEKLVELDSASLKDQITQQQIKVEQARAALIKEETNLEITRSQNDSDIQAAQIALDLAEIDLQKYLEGDYLQERRNIDGEIVIAEEELKRSQDRLEYSERLSKKGFVSTSEVEADRLAVTKTKNALDVAQEKLRVLDEYTKPRTVKDLTSKRDEAQRKLDRVRNEAKAKEAQAQVALQAQRLTTETEESTLRKLERQLEKCVLYAPADGMVVYANDPTQGMRGQPQVQIEEGALLRERQKIIRIPDLDTMLVNVKVHEAKVSHVRPGQAARVRVESMPDKSFSGRVKTVATTADTQSWFSTGVQVFTVMVSIDERVEGLKPGMTAEVEIMADKVPDVLAVPVQAVVEREGQSYCYVLPPKAKDPLIQRVVLGASNDKVVVIKEGLDAGQRVIGNLAAVIDEEDLLKVAKADAEKYKPAEPPAGTLAKAAAPVVAPPRGPNNGFGGPPGVGGPAGPSGEIPPAGGGGGPGGARLLQQLDKNQDGKISLTDEVGDEQRAWMSRLDSNSDGFIDAQELAAMRGRGRPGGGGGFTMPASGADWIKTNDKNSDGKVAKDELPEFLQGLFGTMDSNGDGTVDGTEADALIERMKAMREQGGTGGAAPGGFPGGG